jgi:hypothetical protein
LSTGTQNSLTRLNVALAMVAGAGFILMTLVLGTGVIQGKEADGSTLGLLFAVGLALFVSGLIGWLAVAQPYKHFDDINVPKDTGHHGGHAESHEHSADAGHSTH